MAYTLEQQRDSLRAKIAKLQERERRVQSRLIARERKERTHRLIETGAIVESVVGGAIDKDRLLAYATEHKQELCALRLAATSAKTASKEDAPAPSSTTYDDDDMGDVPVDFAAPAMCD